MTSPSAVSISGITRCGRMTSPPFPAWRHSRTSRLRPPGSTLAWGPFPSTDISRCGSRRRSTASGSIPRSSGSGSALASCARRSGSSSGRSANCVSSSRRKLASSSQPCGHGCAASVEPIADGVLFNWMLPAQAAEARRWVHQGADKAGRATPVVASYVRVAVGSGSRQRLRDEEGCYRNVNDDHRRHFDAMDVPLGSVGVAASARPGCSRDWRRTTPHSTFRSYVCSQNTMRPRCRPSRSPRRREAVRSLIPTTVIRISENDVLRDDGGPTPGSSKRPVWT